MENIEVMDPIQVKASFGHIFDVDEYINSEETNEASVSEPENLPTATSTGLRDFRPVDVESFLESSTNANTKKKTESDMKVFNEFLMSKNEQRCVEFIPPDVLNALIYEPTTLRGFVSSIDRHLKSKNSRMSILNDPDFNKARMVLKGKQKSLKSQGYGNKPKTAEPLNDWHLDKMYEAQTLGDSNPRALIHSMWLLCTTYFGMRTGQEIHCLCWGDVKLHVDDQTGEEYVMLDTERQTKTRTGTNPEDTRVLKPKAFAKPEDSQRDPVYLYKLYRSKRPSDTCTEESPFFLTPGNSTQNCWYRKTPMGINKLYGIMKEMKEEAGINAPRITQCTKDCSILTIFIALTLCVLAVFR